MSRLNESNRPIASINRVDELNQRTELPNDAKTTPKDPLKTAPNPPKTVPRGLKSTQERPKPPPRRPQSDPRPPQERSWNGLGAILEPSKNMIEKQVDFRQPMAPFCVDFGSQNDPPNDPKTTPKRVKNQDKKCITFLSLLDSS